ncbi:ornithine decarboxylase-like isoform X2 [Scylla paramamosain]|uniref:ornithine decarboxylase-like isoform X2 n=1 Tax=Scylla paramamosain TaxID=85552 RepID=UPI003083CCB9
MKTKCTFFAESARILNEETVMDVIREKTEELEQEDPFYILDVGDIVEKVKLWKMKLPRVKPFYAVKCNNHPTVLKILAALGTGFDCASKAEIQNVLQLGVDQTRIIFANPCKPLSHLRSASKLQIPLMTFDSESELQKISVYYPEAKLVIRIRVDATDALVSLGKKFGVLPGDAETLLVAAHTLGLNVVGVAFHVGSGCRDPSAFHQAIISAKMIIAEPGRYMVASAFTLATNIFGKREITDTDGALESIMYFINDGIYGSFVNVVNHHQKFHFLLIKKQDDDETVLPCSIWGPTCDSADQVVPETSLPNMPCGQWLMWPEMGAYTLAKAGTFNGFPIPEVIVVVPYTIWLWFEEHPHHRVSMISVETQTD